MSDQITIEDLIFKRSDKSAVHHSSATPEWSTPQDFFDKLNREFNFTLDPCATTENAKCKYFFTFEQNGLYQDWSMQRIFMNPPYGREIREWMAKAYDAWKHGSTIVCLVPARTDTSWWHDFAMKATEIRYIRGRLKFGGGNNPAPFPSALVIFRGPPLIADP